MSTDRDVERIVRSWMDEGVTALPDRVLDLVLDQIPATPQRRAGWLARRFPVMNSNVVRFGVAAAVVVLAVIVGINFLPGGGDHGGPPEPTPSASAEPTPSASARAYALPSEVATPLTPGRYFLADFPVGLSFEIPAVAAPAEWLACSENVVEQEICYWPTPEDLAGQLQFLIVTNVAADPCGPNVTLLDPAVGPSVDDLVTAISNLEGFNITAPVDISIDGFSGKQFTLIGPTDPLCDGFGAWSTELRTTGMGQSEINVVRIVDVNGVRVMIVIAADPARAEAAAFAQVVASIKFEP